MALPPKLYQFLVGVFASFGSFVFGYDLGVIAEVVASASFNTQFDTPSATATGLVVSLFTAGAFAGAGLAGLISDRVGRRWTTATGCFIFCIGGALQTGAETISYLWGGRFLAGTGVGLLTMIIPLYQAELAHPDIRGTITALQQFMLGVGALVAGWISYGTYIGLPGSNTGQWRIPLGIQIAPALILGSCIFLFPESPRWLIDHGETQKGLETLAKLHAHGNTLDPWVQAEFEQIQEHITYEHETEARSYVELVRSKSSFRRLLLALALQASVQMTGVSAIQYFSVAIYGQVGISGADTLKYQAINNVIALVAEGCCIALIDKLGRRRTIITGNLINMVTFIIAAILIAKYPPGADNFSAHWGFIAMTYIFNASFSFAVGPLSWIIPAEIFDTYTRAKGVAAATMMSFAFNTLIGQITDLAITNIGYKYYVVFAVCNFTNAVFFWLFLPETKKVPLEEMAKMFEEMPLIVVGHNNDRYRVGKGNELDTKVQVIIGEKV